uniref:Prefoldin subunit, putative n=1 Tax=Theileria annulata TaxID=5874 RepID=A0A3B0N5Q2_THEAN
MTSVDAMKATMKRLEKERVTLIGQMEDVSQDSSEHRLVLKNLSKLPSDRKCYRIIGGVAVERTVEEVMPSLASHADMLDQLREKLKGHLDTLNTEINKLGESLQNTIKQQQSSN